MEDISGSCGIHRFDVEGREADELSVDQGKDSLFAHCCHQYPCSPLGHLEHGTLSVLILHYLHWVELVGNEDVGHGGKLSVEPVVLLPAAPIERYWKTQSPCYPCSIHSIFVHRAIEMQELGTAHILLDFRSEVYGTESLVVVDKGPGGVLAVDADKREGAVPLPPLNEGPVDMLLIEALDKVGSGHVASDYADKATFSTQTGVCDCGLTCTATSLSVHLLNVLGGVLRWKAIHHADVVGTQMSDGDH